MKIYENELNVRLASILSESFGLDCRAERIHRKVRPDVRCYHDGFRIIIEASYSASDAEKDASKRVEEDLADMAIALHYVREYPDIPEKELKKMLKESTFNARIIAPKELKSLERYVIGKTKVAEPVGGWFQNIRLDNVADFIKHSVAYLIEEKEVRSEIERIKQVIDDFAKTASEISGNLTLREKVAEILYRLYGFSVAEVQKSEYSDVLFGQTALAILLSAVLYERTRHLHGLTSLLDHMKSLGPINGLRAALDGLIKINYEPALKLAVELLGVLPPTLSNQINRIIGQALHISEMSHLLARDFAGRIYHEITGDIAVRKGFATFYTEIPAAYLLTNLALRTLLDLDDPKLVSEDRAKKLLEAISSIKIADFACGSGTLLTASLYNASRLARTLCFLHNLNCLDIEKKLVEEGIYGLDALRYATQITALNLALMIPEKIVKENIGTIYLGLLPNGTAWLGSLELLNDRKRVDGLLRWIEGGLKGAVETVSTATIESGKIEILNDYDMIVMNPPFTRATGRVSKEFEESKKGLFGFIADETARNTIKKRFDEIRNNMRKELIEIATKLIKEESVLSKYRGLLPRQEGQRGKRWEDEESETGLGQYINIGQAGEGLLFLCLAYKYVKTNGIIAFVLPRNLLSGVTWFLARTLLASKFHLKYVVVSSDNTKGYNFSEGTSLSECLIVAKRTDQHNPEEETVFINLLSKPTSALEAILLAEEISKFASSNMRNALLELSTGSKALATKVNRTVLLENIDNINRFVAFPEFEVLKLALSLIEKGELGIKVHDKVLKVPITRLHDIMEAIGIDAHQFHDLFEVVATKTPYPAIFGGEESIRSVMLVNPNRFVKPKSDEGKGVYQKYSSKLLVPDRIWVDTAHVIALYSEEPVLSNIFYAIRLKASPSKAEDMMKALAYWLNTTWGVLTALLNREETRGRWMRLKMSQWRLFPVIDVTRLDDETLKRLAETFNEVAKRTPKRLPEQYSIHDPDPVRLEIDLGFLNALDPSINEHDAIQQLKDIYKKISIAFERWMSQK